MGRTSVVRGCLQQAAFTLRSATTGPTGVGPATAADAETPEAGHRVLHGHG
ncbi:hypothetical protein AB0M44_13090 [Streptosporangium subroseum]|uniref:hypothetical protein n=1 Tax=Streptosporangium subroseum TaxID=106412 RepID=UPI00342DA371